MRPSNDLNEDMPLPDGDAFRRESTLPFTGEAKGNGKGKRVSKKTGDQLQDLMPSEKDSGKHRENAKANQTLEELDDDGQDHGVDGNDQVPDPQLEQEPPHADESF